MAERNALRLCDKTLIEINKCNPNSLDFIPKFSEFYEYFKKICPLEGYNLRSPYERPYPAQKRLDLKRPTKFLNSKK